MSKKPKPTSNYPTWPGQSNTHRLLEPGYWGHLEDEEIAFIRAALQKRRRLAFTWGFDPAQQEWPAAAIRRVAMGGNPKDRKANAKLVQGPPLLAQAKGSNIPRQPPQGE